MWLNGRNMMADKIQSFKDVKSLFSWQIWGSARTWCFGIRHPYPPRTTNWQPPAGLINTNMGLELIELL